jgi:hypothetical protein
MEQPDPTSSLVGVDTSRIKSQRGFLVVADISGYTRFVLAHNELQLSNKAGRRERVGKEHAEAIVSMLLEAVIDRFEGILTVNKLEGDAALFYALPDDAASFGPKLLEALLASLMVFNERLEKLWQCNGCFCEACCKRGDLRLKVLAHYGEFMVKRVSRFEELAGDEVILIHRLLKNQVPAHEYLLLTDAAASMMPGCEAWEQLGEDVDEFGMQGLRVHYPGDPQVKPRRYRPPWISEIIAMKNLFKVPQSRRLLEDQRRPLSAAITTSAASASALSPGL